MESGKFGRREHLKAIFLGGAAVTVERALSATYRLFEVNAIANGERKNTPAHNEVTKARTTVELNSECDILIRGKGAGFNEWVDRKIKEGNFSMIPTRPEEALTPDQKAAACSATSMKRMHEVVEANKILAQDKAAMERIKTEISRLYGGDGSTLDVIKADLIFAAAGAVIAGTARVAAFVIKSKEGLHSSR